MPKVASRVLPAKAKSIAAAAFDGTGREVEYRIDGIPGLVLAVMAPSSSGASARVWRAYYSATVEGQRKGRKVRLGSYPTIGLAEARRKAAEITETVERGADPVGEQAAVEATTTRASLTFSDLVDDYLSEQRAAAVKTVAEVERALKRDALPVLGNKRPSEISDIEIETVVDGVRDRGSEAMARHLLTYLRGVFNLALDTAALRKKYGLTTNPADRVGRGRRGRRGRYGIAKAKDRYLDDLEIAEFWRVLGDTQVTPLIRIALRLLLLTAQRRGEVLGVERHELLLDCSAPRWELPESKTKNGRAHTVPLTPDAVELFRQAAALSLGRASAGFLFSVDGTEAVVIRGRSLNQAVRRLLEAKRLTINRFTPHDLRRTAATGMRRIKVAQETVGTILNHKGKGGVTAEHYDRHDGFDEKRDALERWAAHIASVVCGCA